MSYAETDLAIVPAAAPTRKNQRATSCPAPISAKTPYQSGLRLTDRAFLAVLAKRSADCSLSLPACAWIRLVSFGEREGEEGEEGKEEGWRKVFEGLEGEKKVDGRLVPPVDPLSLAFSLPLSPSLFALSIHSSLECRTVSTTARRAKREKRYSRGRRRGEQWRGLWSEASPPTTTTTTTRVTTSSKKVQKRARLGARRPRSTRRLQRSIAFR